MGEVGRGRPEVEQTFSTYCWEQTLSDSGRLCARQSSAFHMSKGVLSLTALTVHKHAQGGLCARERWADTTTQMGG